MRQGIAGLQPPTRLSLINDREQSDLMTPLHELNCHLVGNRRTKGVAAEIEGPRRLLDENRVNVTCGDLVDGVSGARTQMFGELGPSGLVHSKNRNE